MLKHRLLMSALLIPATIALFVWDHHLGPHAPVLFVLVLLLATRCIWEFVKLVHAAGYRPSFGLMLIGTWLMICSCWMCYWPGQRWPPWHFFEHLDFLLPAGGVVIVASLFNAVFRFSRMESMSAKEALPTRRGIQIATLGIELFGIAYIGVLLALTTQLRWTTYSEGERFNVGYFALAALVISTKMGDVGAYTFGRLIGGPKMTPVLSPGKTISGGVGHVLTAGLSAVAWLVWIGPAVGTNWEAWRILPAIVFGAVVGFAGLIGDLAESLIKRDVGVKDAPALLPGFGGLLDLMDSLLLAGPVAYGMWHLLRN